MKSKEDQRLIKYSLTGNRLAQGDIYRKYAKAMYHIVIRMIGEKNTAKDITQDVFVKVFEKLSLFRGESTLGAWIKRITINTCLEYLRKAKMLDTEELDSLPVNLANDEDDLVDKVDISTIHKAIKTLPTGCRTVLILYLLEGYDHKEISEILGVSVSTSKSQYSRGKTLLKEKLKTLNSNED